MIFELIELLLLIPALVVFANNKYDFWHSFWVGIALLQLIGIWHTNTLLLLIKLILVIELYFKILNQAVYRAVVYLRDHVIQLEKKYDVINSLRRYASTSGIASHSHGN